LEALYIDKYGGIEEMRYGNLPIPKPGKNQVLIQVMACSVNPVDWKIRSGIAKLISGRKFPKIFGTDFSGIIKKMGTGVTRFKPGDEVFGGTSVITGNNGANAEYVIANKNRIYHKPGSISFEEAAAAPVAALSVLYPLRRMKIDSKSRVLVNGASGGVGSFAVQLFRMRGAEVTAVCSEKNYEFVKDLGADIILDYKKEDLTENNFIYDVIYDAYGKLKYRDVKKCLRSGGYFVTTLGGPLQMLRSAAGNFLFKRKVLTVNASPTVSGLHELSNLLKKGKIKPYITREFAFNEAKAAYEMLENGGTPGKIVIKVKDSK